MRRATKATRQKTRSPREGDATTTNDGDGEEMTMAKTAKMADNMTTRLTMIMIMVMTGDDDDDDDGDDNDKAK